MKQKSTLSLASTVAAADFKATCLKLMDRVARDGLSVTITKRGRKVAVLSPVREKRKSAFGFASGDLRIVGDIVSPIRVAWDAVK